MRLLGIDTTTPCLCLALYDGHKTCEYNLQVGRRLSELIGVHLQRVLDAAGWAVEDIDYFACGTGPGSFTGMRIGVATVKGLAWALGRPVAGVPTLDILAQNVRSENACIIPVIDARRNMVYYSVYRRRGALLKRLAPYALTPVGELIKKVSPILSKQAGRGSLPNIVLGDGLAIYREEILRGIRGSSAADKDAWYPQGNSIVTLALKAIAEKKLSDAFRIKPLYLYPRECQVRTKK